MRTSTILSTLALAATVFAAPVARPATNGDITESNPMDPDGDLAGREVIAISADSADVTKAEKAGETQLLKEAHAASGRVPSKVTIGARDLDLPAGLPTDDLPLQDVKSLTFKVPVDTSALDKVISTRGDQSKGEISTLVSTVSSTLSTLFSKFGSVATSLSSACAKLNTLAPTEIDNVDATLDSVQATLVTIKPQLDDAIDSMQSGNFQNILSQVTTLGASDSVKEMKEVIHNISASLTQLQKDAKAVATGLGMAKYAAKLASIEDSAATCLAKLKSVSGIRLPL